MFKKRTRPASVRKPEESSEPMASGSGSGSRSPPEEQEGGPSQSIDDLIQLRKLKKSLAQPGINLEKFNRGDTSKGTSGEEAIARFGLLGNGKGKGKAEDVLDEDDKERAKRMVRSNNFTQQTNALDVDKHMLAYIEEELSKRKGNTIREGEAVETPYDPQEELFKIVEKYKLDAKVMKETEEGSVTNSLGMLTSIPEVDLGMENRLRNIEATEKAKREMIEARNLARSNPENRDKERGRRKDESEESYAAARFAREKAKIATDSYAIEESKREAAGLLPASYGQSKPKKEHEPRHESATDEQVYDRFKKRMRR